MRLASVLYADAVRAPARYAVETASARIVMHRVPRLNSSRGRSSCRTCHKRHKSSPGDLTDLISTRELRKPEKARLMTTRYALRGHRFCKPRLTAKWRPPLAQPLGCRRASVNYRKMPLTHSHLDSLMNAACLRRQQIMTGVPTR